MVPPMAKPASTRAITSTQMFGAMAPTRPKITPASTVNRNTGRRPCRSACRPQKGAPISMPANVAESSMVAPSAPGGRPKVAFTPGSAKPISRTSMASAAKVRPQMSSSRIWNGPTPSASITPSTVRVPGVGAACTSSGSCSRVGRSVTRSV